MSDHGDAQRPALQLTALSVADVARILTRAGGIQITPEMIARDIVDGAPTNADGTLNLLYYVAWLLKERRRGDQSATTAP